MTSGGESQDSQRSNFFFFFSHHECRGWGGISPCCSHLQGGKRRHSMTKRLSNKRKLNLFQYRCKFPYLNGIRSGKKDQERMMVQVAARRLDESRLDDARRSAVLATARRATQVPPPIVERSTAEKSSARIHSQQLASRSLRSFFQSDD